MQDFATCAIPALFNFAHLRKINELVHSWFAPRHLTDFRPPGNNNLKVSLNTLARREFVGVSGEFRWN